MSAKRFAAILLIFAVVGVGWAILAGSVVTRTGDLDEKLSEEMRSLWGPKVLAQSAPVWTQELPIQAREKNLVVTPDSSQITAAIAHENRDKGLLWYSTFAVDFAGEYGFAAAGAEESAEGVLAFDLPAGVTPVDLTAAVDGEAIELPYEQRVSGQLRIPLTRDRPRTVTVSYTAAGQDYWAYCPGAARIPGDRGRDDALPVESTRGELRDFEMTVTTDFANIDYPRGSRAPTTEATVTDAGTTSRWRFESVITSQPMGVVMPQRTNAGPIVARMSLFAPVSLLFFFTAVFTVCVLKKVPLHPMHYLFLAAGFFVFHILLAYLADHVDIHAAFWIAAAASVLLVVSYLRLAAGVKFALVYAGLAQLVYLVGFSYAFFWRGMTGLTVTIGAVATLFVLMQATGRVNWFEVFRPARPSPSPPPVPAAQPAPQSRP